MPEESGGTVEFSGRVPQREYDFFRVTFPQYGATTWFINYCLKAFNDKVRHNPAVADVVDEMIDEMLKINREQS